jgi:hypothetical protein
MDDDYTFDRIALPHLRFEHLTRALTFAIDGEQVASENWTVTYGLTFLADDLVRSTTLTNGDAETGNDFSSRDYVKSSASLKYSAFDGTGAENQIEFGLSSFGTSEDASHITPHLRLQRIMPWGAGDFGLFADYAGAAQVAGYTALKSNPGLFGGNPNLGTEVSRVWESGLFYEVGSWRARANIFFRKDDRLVDWVYDLSSTSARNARQVDLESLGVELELIYQTNSIKGRISYAWLEKEADYGSGSAMASFYALNFPLHRATAGVAWEFVQDVELEAEVAYRVAEENPLRSTGERGLGGRLALRWRPLRTDSMELMLLLDNLFNDDFEDFPGTPAVGRQVSTRLRYAW